MSDPYLGEIRMVAFTDAAVPNGWALCDGSILQMDDNKALYSLLGTNFGGDGQSTFAIPDLTSAIAVHIGTGEIDITLGEEIGLPSVTLLPTQMPMHTHPLMASAAAASTTTPQANLLASFTDGFAPASAGTTTSLLPATITPTGSATPHENRQPYLCINFMIAVQGIWP